MVDRSSFFLQKALWGIHLTMCWGCSLSFWIYNLSGLCKMLSLIQVFQPHIGHLKSDQKADVIESCRDDSQSSHLCLSFLAVLWPLLVTALFLKMTLFTVKAIHCTVAVSTTLLISHIFLILIFSQAATEPLDPVCILDIFSCSHIIHSLEELALWITEQVYIIK